MLAVNKFDGMSCGSCACVAWKNRLVVGAQKANLPFHIVCHFIRVVIKNAIGEDELHQQRKLLRSLCLHEG